MGGDHAPHATIAGALLALAELDASHALQLVGRTDEVRRELDALVAPDAAMAARARERITVVEAPQVVEMSDKPAAALRSKANSSMSVGLKLQAAGKSDAFVSAGNTGAQMAASTLILKLHDGLTRPAIGTVFPTVNHPVVVLDSGANVDCSAEELVQFARLGATYAELYPDKTGRLVLDVGEADIEVLSRDRQDLPVRGERVEPDAERRVAGLRDVAEQVLPSLEPEDVRDEQSQPPTAQVHRRPPP